MNFPKSTFALSATCSVHKLICNCGHNYDNMYRLWWIFWELTALDYITIDCTILTFSVLDPVCRFLLFWPSLWSSGGIAPSASQPHVPLPVLPALLILASPSPLTAPTATSPPPSALPTPIPNGPIPLKHALKWSPTRSD